jgi:stage V sporulation protein D (sporulation-specific penicillin-binding protein)
MFFNNIHTRIRFVFSIITICLIIIILRVFYIQVFEYNKLSSLADNLWSRNLPVAADRGRILDRNGKVIADNITTTSLVVVPNQIKDKEYASEQISKILNCDKEKILKHLNKSVSIERVHPEGRQLSYDIAEQINNLNIDGVYLLKESKRNYPYPNVLSHVLGYVGIDNQGLSGLELYYNSYLTGKNGSIKYLSDGKGHKLNLAENYEAPTSGVDIKLTIDLDLQLAAENEIENAMSKYNAEGAMILAMNPKTGEILAMASRPTFDSNNYQNSSTEIINRNLPIWMTFEPGSTFKIMTLASSINEKTINLFTDTYNDSGSINVEGATLHCWKKGGHGTETYLEVVENSCNTGFVSLGQKLGKERLMGYIKNFGFGTKTGIDLNGETSGILFNIDKMGPVETATTAFGQGVSVTPIQQVTAVSAAINGGYLYTPYLVKDFLDPETKNVIKENTPNLKRQVITEESSALVRYALESVVANGTGRNAYIENYRVGGKTGTAQKVINGTYSHSDHILSFIGFMPANDPDIVVYVAIDNPKGVTHYGGTVSAPIAKSFLESAIKILNIEPSKEGMSKEYTWLDTKYNKLPNVVGMSLEAAQKTLKGYKLNYTGNGTTITYQNPQEGYFVKDGSTVELLLN